MSRKPYPSDVSDEEWSFVAPYLELTRFRGHIWSLGFRPRLFRTLR